ncbi:MAG: hypothetical protein JW739_00705 [Opitutales bacterium]|nr:hypothetical protein [Opitutales bacterium]
MTENNSDAQPLLQSSQTSDEIDLIELFDTYVRPYWRRYCVAGLIGGFLFAVASVFVTPQYEATTTAQVYTGDSTNMKSGFGGLASLAGISMNAGNTDVLFNTKYIRSRELADAFIAQYDLRKELFYKGLNESDEFKPSFSLRKALTGWMSSNPVEGIEDEDIFTTPGPTKEQVYKKFEKTFLISVNNKDMTADVTVRWKDPLKAKQWANAYIQFVNGILREKAIRESNLKIQYLESQIDKNRSIEVQQSIYSLIENELKQIAVAESSEQYAFKVIERAFLPERKSSPNRKLYLLMGGFLGVFIVFARIFTREFLSSLRKTRK